MSACAYQKASSLLLAGPPNRGSGLALLPRFRADAEPTLCQIRTSALVPPAEIWLGVHRENRQVRTVLDIIAEAVRSRGATLNPPEMAKP